MAIKIPGVRIALLNPATTKKLHELRSFRYRFRNVYGYMLDFNKLKDLLAMLPAALRDMRSDLTLFRKKMREMYDLPAD